MALPWTFANLTQIVTTEWDDNYNALGALVVLPCTVVGTNALALTLSPAAATPTINAYANYMVFSGIAVAANTGATTAAVGALPALNVYRDTPAGPVALTGGELQPGNAFKLTYDSALNAAAGGFHLETGGHVSAHQQAAVNTVNSAPGVTLTAAQVTGNGLGQGIILRTGAAVGGFNDQMPIAADIKAAMPTPVAIGDLFRLRIRNTTGQIQTITTNTGITLNGTVTTADSTTHDFIGVFTAVGTPAVTLYG